MSQHRGKIVVVLCVAVTAILAALVGGKDRQEPQAAQAAVAGDEKKSDSANDGTGEDYLPAELRAAVERLKRDVRAKPTDEANGKERARTVWRWANAYSLQGGELPVELPLVCAAILAWQDQSRVASRVGSQYTRLDNFIHELEVREEFPDAIGPLTSDVTTSFEAGSHQTIEQTYRVGRMAMSPGGGVLVARHFMSDHGNFQTADSAADNYVTIRSSNPMARFVVTSTQVGGMHGGFFTPADGLVFRLEGAPLAPGDTVTVVYGDRTGGSRGFLVQTYSNDRFPLPLYVDLEAKGNFFTLPIIGYNVTGKAVRGVHGFATSVVAAGEPFELSVRSEDEYYNRATGPIPAYEITVNGGPFRSIEASDEPITLLKDVRFDEPGIYRFAIRSADGKIVGDANPVWVKEDASRRVFWGETHGHSGFAEGQGTADAFFRFGRDEARLDFLTHSEHDVWMDDAEWNTLVSNTKKYLDEGNFITFLGYEWTMSAAQGGHHNVLFRTPDNRHRVPQHDAPVLSQLYQQLGDAYDMDDVLVIPHAHEPGEYRFSHPRLENLVEIMSMHGRHEWFGIMYLRHGHEVGFIAASDDHLSHPGYPTPTARGLADNGGLAAAVAAERTSDSIFDALKALSAYATTGARILVDYSLNGGAMGTRVPQAAERALSAKIIGTSALDSVAIVKNGVDVQTWDLATARDGSNQYEIRFSSDCDPEVRDSPRGWRPWTGTLRVTGAKLVGFSAPSLRNPRTEYCRAAAGSSDTLEFSALTRGSEKSIVLELADVTDAAAIEVTMAAATEISSTPPKFRPVAELPAEQYALRLADIDGGTARHDTQLDRYTDRLWLRRLKSDVPLEFDLSWTDANDAEEGDYYYLRVRQLDGHMAWSSPIWVGGFSPQ